MSSLVSYGKLRPSFIGVLSIIVRSLLTRTSASIDRVKLCTVDELIDFSDSGIWGDVSIDPASELRVFRVSDFKGDFELDYSSPPYRAITEQQKQKYKLAGGDILVVKSSGSAKQVVSGRVAVFESNGDDQYAASNFLMRLRPKKDMVDSYYLGFVLGSPLIREEIANSVKTMTYPNLSYKLYRRITVPIVAIEDQKQIAAFLTACLRREELLALPPYLSEPRQIVARIEELAAKIDEARGLRQKAVEEAEAIHASTAVELLKAVLGMRRSSIENIAEVRGGIQKGPHRTPGSNPVRYLTVAHVHRNQISLADPRFFEVSPDELERWRLERGDVLIIEGNGSLNQIGRTALFRGELDNCVHQNHIIRIRPNQSQIDPEFLNTYLNSPTGQDEVHARSRTTSGLRNLSVGRIKQITVPVPPLPEQRRIVAYLDNLQDTVNALKQLQSETYAELDAMLPSILDKAFRGDLS